MTKLICALRLCSI